MKRPDQLARWLSPTLAIGIVDVALGVELILSERIGNSTFVTISGGKTAASLMLIAVGVFTIAGTLVGERTRRAAPFVNGVLWSYITATAMQRPTDTATLLLPTLTAGYALCSILRYIQLRGLRRDSGG